MLPLLAASIGLTAAAPAAAQGVPWQRPPRSAEFGAWAEQAGSPALTARVLPGDGISGLGEIDDASALRAESCAEDGCTAIAARGPCVRPSLLNDPWVRAEALLWWTKGADVPALLTTSTSTAPQLQTVVLLGDEEVAGGFQAGGRIAFGTWLDACDSVGIEFVYLGLSQRTRRFEQDSDGNPILARPFFDVDLGAENFRLIAMPDALQGEFSCTATSEFQAAEFLTRWAIARGPNRRIELLAGYRFQRLTDGLDIADASRGASPTSQIRVFDQFHTQNDFHGGELGVAGAWRRCRWSLEGVLKLALGGTQSRTDIDGSTITTAGAYAGGMLALPSNMGRHEAGRFSAVPEVGATVGYDLTCRLRATAGYTFVYWSNVARPGDQIDRDLDPSQFPPPTAAGARPAFVERYSDFWAQGIHLGLDYRF